MRAYTLSAFLLPVLLSVGVRADSDRSTEAEEAAITDPTLECEPYGIDLVSDNLQYFPDIWEYAQNILPGDTEGLAAFSKINASIPNIAPRGTLDGSDLDEVQDSYDESDPYCWWTYSNCVSPKLKGLSPDIATVPEPRTLGYAFDDGPYCGHNIFYDFLTEMKQKATFFYIGSNVLDWPLEAQRATVDGHQVCVHTWSHQYMTSMSNEGAFAELWYAMKAIKLVTGITPTCWRPPYGDVDDRIRWIAKVGLNLDLVIWKYDSNDWEEGTDGYTAADVQKNYNKLIQRAQNGTFNKAGTIMLTHELTNFTMQCAMDNHAKLEQVFDHLVPIATAMNVTNPCQEAGACPMPTFEEYTAKTGKETQADRYC